MSQHRVNGPVRTTLSGGGTCARAIAVAILVAALWSPSHLAAGTGRRSLVEDDGDHYRTDVHEHVKPHQHNYSHSHWHTHVLDDGTIVHHSHTHSHTYWHYGADETDREKATRVPDDQERAAPTEETGARAAGTEFKANPAH